MKSWKILDDIQTMEYSKLIKWMFIVVVVLVAITFGIANINGTIDERAVKLGSESEAIKETLVNATMLWFFCVNWLIINRHFQKLFSLISGTITKSYKDSDAYIYERELPKYNAAIAGALFDLKSTFEEDYIAGVMDLIARGYLIEEHDEIKINEEKSKEDLSNCEIFILKVMQYKSNDGYKLSHKYVNSEFYKALKKDLRKLGFYKEYTKSDKLFDWISYATKSPMISFWLPMIIFLILGLILVVFEGYTLFVLCVAFAFFMIWIRENRLTQKGEIEKERISKLRNFLQNETNLDEKENNEKALWDRYPAFAVALDVNNKMADDIKEKLKNIAIIV